MKTKYIEVTIEKKNPLSKKSKKGILWLYFRKHIEKLKDTYHSFEAISETLSKQPIVFNVVLEDFYNRCNKDIEKRLNKEV